MRTLKDHIILYDADCPMCNLYTSAFVKAGMLDENGREPYQNILGEEGKCAGNSEVGYEERGLGKKKMGFEKGRCGDETAAVGCAVLDRQRAVDEIALVDTRTGEVSYGINSLFKVIGNAVPVFRPLFGWGAFGWLMRKVYSFVSYNRKVIIPSPVGNGGTPQPTFKWNYRALYFLFTAVIAGTILTHYARRIGNVHTNEYAIAAGQLLFQGIVVRFYSPRKVWDYLGNMMTISLAGSLLLLPMLAFKHPEPLVATGYFGLVAGLMLAEHIRRTKLLGMGWAPTLSWICYRLLVLAIILLSR